MTSDIETYKRLFSDYLNLKNQRFVRGPRKGEQKDTVRTVMYTQTFAEPLEKKHNLRRQYYNTFPLVWDLFRHNSIASCIMAPGVTKLGRIHYHYLVNIKNSYIAVQLPNQLQRHGLGQWSEHIVTDESFKREFEYLYKNAREFLSASKIKDNLANGYVTKYMPGISSGPQDLLPEEAVLTHVEHEVRRPQRGAAGRQLKDARWQDKDFVAACKDCRGEN